MIDGVVIEPGRGGSSHEVVSASSLHLERRARRVAAACSDANDGALQPPGETLPTPAPVELCAQAPSGRLCSFLLRDVIVALPNAYQGITPQLQRPFDQFSWQMFVALNWPASADGTPPDDPILQAFAKSSSRPEISLRRVGRAETAGVDQTFQDALADTVWSNYRSSTRSGSRASTHRPFSNLSIPRYLGNAVLETTSRAPRTASPATGPRRRRRDRTRTSSSCCRTRSEGAAIRRIPSGTGARNPC